MTGESSSASAGEFQQQHQPHLHKAPASRITLSPTHQTVHTLVSNDDELERAKTRAVRAAASRRHSAAVPSNTLPPDNCSSQNYFSEDRVRELFRNCLKLANENKINQKNTWDLELIDHLSEIIRVDAEGDADTNFQQASCSLEAGMKIYSARVDSLHSDAYKALRYVIHLGGDDDKDKTTVSCQKARSGGSEPETKISPLSTVASTFDELNIKNFDVAFTVDPLYHQTSMKFDEGGVKGLLLNNLGVYGNCKLIFDSFEDPRRSISCETKCSQPEKIDLAFAREEFQMVLSCMPVELSISPSLKDIIELLNEENKGASTTLPEFMNTRESDKTNFNFEVGSEVDGVGHWNSDIDDQHSTVDNDSIFLHRFTTSQEDDKQDRTDTTLRQPPFDDSTGKIAEFLALQKGLIYKPNSWYGLDHWAYHKTKGPLRFPDTGAGTGLTRAKKKVGKHHPPDFGFSRFVDMKISDIYKPPRNCKSLLVPSGGDPCNVTLPEDCHYHPESLVKLFLLPDNVG